MIRLILGLLACMGPSGSSGALVAVLFSFASVFVDVAPQHGDLVFVDLACGPLCDAIEEVTVEQFGGAEPRWSHVGVFAWTAEGPVVIEARGPVRATPWAVFLRETWALAPGDGGGVILCMLRPALAVKQRQALVQRVRARIDAPYDEVFRWGGPAWYCSELVATALAEVGAPAAWAAPLPMSYGSAAGTPRAFETWRSYFASLGQPIPEGQPGLSPLALWRRLGKAGRPGLCLGARIEGAPSAPKEQRP